MTAFEKTIQIITAIIALSAFIWSIISSFVLNHQNKKIAKLQSCIERGNHVSRIVFDKIFDILQEASVNMFECYNCAGRQMFPFYEDAIKSVDNPKYELEKMLEVQDDAKEFLNALIEITQLNRFIIPCELLEELEAFEMNMKIIMHGYSEKIEKLENFEDEEQMKKLAEQLQDDYKEFTFNCRTYIETLQIVD